MTNDDPTLSELRRRIDETRGEMRKSFSSLGERLDKLPTANELTLQFGQSKIQLDAVVRDIKRVEDAGNKRMDGIEADQEAFEDRLETQRRWSVGIALTVASVMIGLGGFILSVVAK